MTPVPQSLRACACKARKQKNVFFDLACMARAKCVSTLAQAGMPVLPEQRLDELLAFLGPRVEAQAGLALQKQPDARRIECAFA